MNIINKVLAAGLVVFTTISCNQGPTKIPANESVSNQETGVFGPKNEKGHNHPTHVTASKAIKRGVHKVVLKDMLPTVKYVYLHVEENGKLFWLATLKKDLTIGNTYVYKEGLLKTNFESKEHNRVFDTIYLVSSLMDNNHGVQVVETEANSEAKEASETTSTKVIAKEGSTRIGDIVSSPSDYANKVIQITGKCTKVNPNIMKRNWIHIDDGTNDGFDFVVTSNDEVPVGHTITLSGVITVNKDFGAGYVFDVIMEDGKVVK